MTTWHSWRHLTGILCLAENLIDSSTSHLLHADWSICTTWPKSGSLIGHRQSDPSYYYYPFLQYFPHYLRGVCSVPLLLERFHWVLLVRAATWGLLFLVARQIYKLFTILVWIKKMLQSFHVNWPVFCAPWKDEAFPSIHIFFTALYR